MISRFRRSTQVVVLTCMLVFGSLLMLGSFEMPSWSDPHHGGSYYHKIHKSFLIFYYGHTMHEGSYASGGHGNTSH